MTTSTRKRGATFLLEKPLASRLPFEVEQPFSTPSTFPPPKRVKPAATSSWCDGDDDLDEQPCCTGVKSEPSETQENSRREELDAADVKVEVEVDGEKGCWLAAGRDKRGGGGGGGHDEGGKGASACVQELAATASAGGNSGPGRALKQLKIDAMFAAPTLPPKGCSAWPGQLVGTEPSGEAECAGALLAKKAEGGMDVDSGGVGVDAGEGEGGSSCYACRGGLGTEGGDVLCSFCDRAACQGCWQNCYACEVPYCSLCLAADYSSQFECYFCPPCYQDRRLESC